MEKKNGQPSLFSARLRYLRKQAGLTQLEMARRLSIHRTTYTKYETESIAPDQEGLLRIAEIFGVTVDFLLGRTGESPAQLAVHNDEESDVPLDEQEKLLLQAYRQLSAEQRQVWLEAVRRSAAGKTE